ncbi:GNAT family N-acetyltransferase [Candidatus Pelagibacter sp.]|nr:GNAT family N-acetyltransferase [Candidatus Pelagibacter sp.]
MKKKFNLVFYKYFNKELENEWKELEKNSNISLFQSYNWQKFWFQNCGGKYENLNVLIYANKVLISILPLNINKKLSVKILNWNGFPFSDYNGPIIRKNFDINYNDFEQIILNIRKIYKFDILHLINNRPEIKFIKGFITNYSYGSNISSGNLYNNLLKILKKNTGYEMRRIEKDFNVEYIMNPNELQINEIINFFLIQKEKQLKRTNGWNYLRFADYKNYIINLKKLDQININFTCIKINKKIIASHIGYTFDNIYYYIFPTYDIFYKKYSPGNILLYKILENIKINEFNYIDFTIGNEIYKRKLSNTRVDLSDYLKPFSIKGFIYFILIKGKFLLKKINYLLKK